MCTKREYLKWRRLRPAISLSTSGVPWFGHRGGSNATSMCTQPLAEFFLQLRHSSFIELR